MRFKVTVGRKRGVRYEAIARAWAESLGVEYMERPMHRALSDIMQEEKLDAMLVATQQGPQVVSLLPDNENTIEFAYHPGMAVLRLLTVKRGEPDRLAEALELKSGMRVLDCTMGLACDSAIISYFVGAEGKCVALEASKLLHFVVSQGLKSHEAEDEDLTRALRRIEALQVNSAEYLANCQPDSFDVVYFDPMFRYPVKGCATMDTMRPLTYKEALPLSTVELALKVATKVVIKERTEGLLQQWGCTEFVGGRYAKVKYGIRYRE